MALTPRLGFTRSEHERDYRVGYGITPLERNALRLEIGVETHVRQNPRVGGSDKGFMGRASLGW